MDFRRALLAISLGLILMLIWQAWLNFQDEKARVAQVTQTDAAPGVPTSPSSTDQPQSAATGEVSDAPAVPSAPSAPVPAVGGSAESSALESTQRIKILTDLLKVEIDTYGGEIREAKLPEYPVEVDMPDVPFRLLTDTGPGILVAQSGLVGTGGAFPNHKTEFTAEAQSYVLSDSDSSLEVPLRWTSPEGVNYLKTFTFYRDSYLIDVEFTVDNQSGSRLEAYQYGQYLSTEYVEESEGFLFFKALPSYKGAALYTPENKYDKIDYKEIRNDSPAFETESGWVAMLQHYFMTAWLPYENAPYEFYTRPLRDASGETRYLAGYVARTPTVVENNSVASLRTQIYVGPKEQDRIKDPSEGLILTVDYGWLTPVSSPLFWVLQKINDVVKNWGWSIILLTLLVKIVFYPLSAASYKSMAKMKKLQPRLKTLKERYGDDKQKLNQEMMQIYKKDKINPLGGCLPILIQIPVFIALYWVLLESVELRQAPFIFWLNDLSRADPFYVLPVLMGASMFAQQFLNPTPLDSLQKNIMMSLPIVFTFFFLWFPSGLVLYWLVNNVLSIAQQWYITKKLAAI
ncbi:MAG: membrane protein insertase YidC [Acidiferrobacterales bacterium]|nr:membrane protein insertase YidC [Acidiferrobacterales bacterium]